MNRPILFSGPLVRAILDGRKTVTRRPICRSRPNEYAVTMSDGSWLIEERIPIRADPVSFRGRCPYGKPGDRLFVKESHRAWCLDGGGNLVRIEYRSGGHRDVCSDDLPDDFVDRFKTRKDGTLAWKPSIFTAREASRITLEITDVRVERVQDITEEQARAEGVDPRGNPSFASLLGDTSLYYLDGFRAVWDSIYAGRTDKPGLDWSSNPWVWVVEFKRVGA